MTVDEGRRRRRLTTTIGLVAAALAIAIAGAVWLRNSDAAHRQAPTVLVSAVDATEARERFGFSHVLETSDVPSAPKPGAAEGQYDLRRAAGWLRVVPTDSETGNLLLLPPAAGQGPDAVFDADHVYLRSDLLSGPHAPLQVPDPPPTPWVVFGPAGEDGRLPMVSTFAGRPNLSALIEQVSGTGSRQLPRDLSNEVGTLVAQGHEPVRGVNTTRYQVDHGQSVPERMQVTVWIDDAGLLRRIQSVASAPGVGDPTAPPIHINETVELFDFGAPLRFDIPPPAEVSDATGQEVLAGRLPLG